jgi:hypothetical protein
MLNGSTLGDRQWLQQPYSAGLAALNANGDINIGADIGVCGFG